MEQAGGPESFRVMGRGELQLAILIEMMRREGYELMVGKPEILTQGDRRQDARAAGNADRRLPGDVSSASSSKSSAPARARCYKMVNHGSGRVRLEFHVPSRGLIGLRSEMLTDTRGTAIMNSLFHGYIAWQGDIPTRPHGLAGGGSGGEVDIATRSGICRSAARSSSRRAPKFTKE